MSVPTGRRAAVAAGREPGSARRTAAGAGLSAGRRRRGRRRIIVIAALSVAIAAVFAALLMFGHTFYGPGEVWRVVLGQDVDGASFTVGTLRLPRAVLGVLAGLSFGMAGVAFQTMLRNPLASPDIIGISAGASAAAAFAIIVLGLSGSQVSVFAIVAGLAIAMLIYLLSYKSGVLGTRLILIGIGIAAMLESVIAYLLSRAGEWDLQEAMRWLSGSLNGARWEDILPLAIALLVLTPLLLGQARNLAILQLGDDAASALGVRVNLSRVVIVVSAVGLISFATAAAGPIAFVAFLSGPIAARMVGPHGSLLIPAALTGALLVLVADFCGQWLLGTRYPVGVVTGALGAPFLLYLIISSNRKGGSL
ncbi:FecCD family ABC transporter permease [Demequina aurantiaca]|uniref:FecCD family ABC transporter permease n=1 Tax=Demequina aurantiaca TaxID=676200 RepID=UPI003D34A341